MYLTRQGIGLSFARAAAPSLAHPAFWPALALLAVYVGSYLGFAAQLIGFPFDLDQGEGYDAWSGWLINLGQMPYGDNASFPYYSHGYPPLWSYLVSIPLAWGAPALASARAVSTLAALLAAVVLGLAARRRAGSAAAGLLAGAFFLGSPYVFHTTPLARVNGTTLLVELLALWLLEIPTRTRTLAASVVLVAALFTKPTAVDAVAAGILFLALGQPRRAVIAGGLVATLGLTVLAALQMATRGAYAVNVLVSNTSPFLLGQLVAYASNVVLLHPVILALAATEVAQTLRRRPRSLSPWHLYAVTSTLLALATVGKSGAGESYFLGALAAASMLAAVQVDRLVRAWRRQWPPRPALAYGLAAALLAQCLLLAHGALSDAIPWLPDRGLQAASLGHAPTAADRRAGEEIVGLMRAVQGPVLAEDASFAVAAGKPLVGGTPPSLRNLYQAGMWDPSPLVADLHAHRFGMVVLNAQLYPEPVLAAIGQAYFQVRTVQVNNAVYRVFLPGS